MPVARLSKQATGRYNGMPKLETRITSWIRFNCLARCGRGTLHSCARQKAWDITSTKARMDQCGVRAICKPADRQASRLRSIWYEIAAFIFDQLCRVDRPKLIVKG
jgi:hypothetical protein